MNFEEELEGEVVKARTLGRAVVAKRVSIVAVVTVFVQLAVSYGWFSIDVSNQVLHYLDVILTGVGALVAIGVTHPAVTPVGDPRNDAGTALVPVSQVEALVANAVAEAKGGHLQTAVNDVTKAADDAVESVQHVAETVKNDIAPVVAVAEAAVNEPETPAETPATPVLSTDAAVDDSDDVTVDEEDSTVTPSV